MAIIIQHPSASRDNAALATVRRLVAEWRARRRVKRDERRIQEMVAALDEAALKDLGLDNLAGPRR